jgi:hypothetical protein
MDDPEGVKRLRSVSSKSSPAQLALKSAGTGTRASAKKGWLGNNLGAWITRLLDVLVGLKGGVLKIVL